jgi:hypothetical protein
MILINSCDDGSYTLICNSVFLRGVLLCGVCECVPPPPWWARARVTKCKEKLFGCAWVNVMSLGLQRKFLFALSEVMIDVVFGITKSFCIVRCRIVCVIFNLLRSCTPRCIFFSTLYP